MLCVKCLFCFDAISREGYVSGTPICAVTVRIPPPIRFRSYVNDIFKILFFFDRSPP